MRRTGGFGEAESPETSWSGEPIIMCAAQAVGVTELARLLITVSTFMQTP